MLDLIGGHVEERLLVILPQRPPAFVGGGAGSGGLAHCLGTHFQRRYFVDAADVHDVIYRFWN